MLQSMLDPLLGITMYSRDPLLARRSMVYTAQRELQKLHEAQASEQATLAHRRAENLAHEEERMRLLARAMADEMVKRVQSQSGSGG